MRLLSRNDYEGIVTELSEHQLNADEKNFINVLNCLRAENSTLQDVAPNYQIINDMRRRVNITETKYYGFACALFHKISNLYDDLVAKKRTESPPPEEIQSPGVKNSPS